MDSYLKQKVKKLVKSVMKNNKDVIEDLMDPNRTSEADLNSVATNRTSAVLQRNEDEEECKCKGEKDCECDKVAPVDDEMEKAEEFIKSVIKNFKAISEAYIQKMEKSRMINDEEKRKLQYMKESADYNQHQKKIKGTKLDYDHPQFGEDKEKTSTLESSEVEKKEGKPFHGYNKNKHSVKGGLSKKGREKINRETGSNLKAPVSSKAAKKSPKKAARRKSFCARMSGVNGPTSKKGKLTPKGAALKRWDC